MVRHLSVTYGSGYVMATVRSSVLPLVLIVDDYPDTCDMYAAYLDLAGFRSLKANDGYEALRVAAESLPDVILMDLGLPRIDGYEVTRRLKGDLRTRHIPVIALTAHATPQQFDELVASGFDDLILKPCLPDALAEEVQRFIKRTRREEAASEMTSPSAA
jgi:two-component system cell cycle response regulator DivK